MRFSVSHRSRSGRARAGLANPRITYFPVGNGDCSLITLSDDTQIVIDCNTTQEASDEDDPSRYDVHQHLLDFGKKLDGEIR
ncbi:hypothetical protein [Bradyrhizobium uaiense]|uniref:Uncharacterized protein n=1 Tax=Bradyrhizobium uaiense TaxID=2594946 RepID=A0A6P1BV77_9BRAD|nr:hypothetical protein [Bradyrhizobium uaiense]NEV01523.1 hypothetical protein [Bradyrhizobium uaiense]